MRTELGHCKSEHDPEGPTWGQGVRFLEGPLPLRTQGKSDLLRSPFASKVVLRGTFFGLPPSAPLLVDRFLT